jgi:hypothetical protein
VISIERDGPAAAYTWLPGCSKREDDKLATSATEVLVSACLSADAYFLPAGIYTLYILQNTVPDNYGLRNYYKRGAFNILKVQ